MFAQVVANHSQSRTVRLRTSHGTADAMGTVYPHAAIIAQVVARATRPPCCTVADATQPGAETGPTRNVLSPMTNFQTLYIRVYTMVESNWFTFLCLVFSFVVCCAPAMAINGFVDGLFDEEPPKRGGRKPSPRRGLPDDKSLHELARTYLESQHAHWPELAQCGVLPPICDEAVSSLASSFTQHFLDNGWRPFSQGLATSHHLKIGAAYLRFSSDNSNPRSLNQQLVNCLNR